MKRITLTVWTLIAFSMLACSKTNEKPKNERTVPKCTASTVPQQLANGLWFSGTLSAISYYDRDGHELGNDYEADANTSFIMRMERDALNSGNISEPATTLIV
jgi:hypothetical protein